MNLEHSMICLVLHRVVDAEIVLIAPSRTAPRLQALLAQVSA